MALLVVLLLITLYLVVVNNVILRLLKATVEFVWWGDVGWWLGLQSHFRVQPNYSVEVVLSLGL